MTTELQALLQDAEKLALPRSRKAALESGVGHYFTGKPCKRGHLSKRHSSGVCLECDKEQKEGSRARRSPEEREAYNAKQRAPNLARARAYLSCPERRRDIREKERAAAATPKRRAVKAAADAARWESMTAFERETMYALRQPGVLERRATAEGAARYLLGLAKLKQWVRDNPAKTLARSRRYQLTKRAAVPGWLTSEMHAEIISVYEAAASARSATGEVYEVDHIVPICSNLVCGLHVPWNLQVLTQHANRKKGNKILDYVHYEATA